jgi:hypothetical protein
MFSKRVLLELLTMLSYLKDELAYFIPYFSELVYVYRYVAEERWSYMASEVAQLRQRIADEYLAAKWGLTGLAYGTSQHQFITSRMDNMGESFAQLTHLLGSSEKAMQIVVDTLEALPDKPTRQDVLKFLRQGLDESEETAMLIEHIAELWKIIDLLMARFGSKRALIIINAPSFVPTREVVQL